MDGFPDGCPTGNDPMKACRTMVEKGIVLYSVGCEPAILRHKDFFMGMAFMTGGQYVPLSQAQALSKVRVNFFVSDTCLTPWDFVVKLKNSFSRSLSSLLSANCENNRSATEN